MVEYKYIIKKGVDFMYYTILTAIDNYGGKSFFNGSAKTESKSVDRAIEQFTIHKLDFVQKQFILVHLHHLEILVKLVEIMSQQPM